MRNKVCCCFGHRELYKDVSVCVGSIIEDLVVNKGVKSFMTGGMGRFDDIFAFCVREKKREHPDIELVLVCPYLTKALNANKEWYEHNYDSVLIPSELVGKHYKSAIKARNRWMIDNSDYIVSYVNHTYGGAYDAVCYARRQGKEIYDVTE